MNIFLSSDDIDKGARWTTTLAEQLETTDFGIICLTVDNLSAPWILFEAGALAKIMAKGRVAPVLFGVNPLSFSGPLSQFQATKFEREDFLRLIENINSASPEQALDSSRLTRAFDRAWPNLESQVNDVVLAHSEPRKEPQKPDVPAILEELIVLARQQNQVINDILLKEIAEVVRSIRREMPFGDTPELSLAELRHMVSYLQDLWQRLQADIKILSDGSEIKTSSQILLKASEFNSMMLLLDSHVQEMAALGRSRRQIRGRREPTSIKSDVG